jgi:hypothetical protein
MISPCQHRPFSELEQAHSPLLTGLAPSIPGANRRVQAAMKELLATALIELTLDAGFECKRFR